MSNAKLKSQNDGIKPFFKLSISEIVKNSDSEYEVINEYYANNNQVIKNNNIINVTEQSHWIYLPEKFKKIFIKNIDRITILDDSDLLNIELTVEFFE